MKLQLPQLALLFTLYMLLFWAALAVAAFGQADTTHVSGLILKPDGKSPAIGAVVYALRSVRSGSVITSQSVEWKAGRDGLVHMTLPRNSVTYLYAPLVPSLNNPRGVAVTIPDVATASLSSLVPATTVPSGYVVTVPQVDTSASHFWRWSQTDTSGAAYWTGQAASWRHPAPMVWNVDLDEIGALESVYADAASGDVIHITTGPVQSTMAYPPTGKSFFYEIHGAIPSYWPGTGGNWNSSNFAYQRMQSAIMTGDTLSYCMLTYADMSSSNFDTLIVTGKQIGRAHV